MAIYKEIHEVFDGEEILYCYHRVTSVVMITNVHNIIEVNSYRNQTRRNTEKKEIKSGSEITVNRKVRYITMPYVADNPVVAAYDYLKTLPEFKDAVDVLEDEQEQLSE